MPGARDSEHGPCSGNHVTRRGGSGPARMIGGQMPGEYERGIQLRAGRRLLEAAASKSQWRKPGEREEQVLSNRNNGCRHGSAVFSSLGPVASGSALVRSGFSALVSFFKFSLINCLKKWDWESLGSWVPE